jgi:hypothetical protein
MEQYFLDHYFSHPLNLNTDNVDSGAAAGKHYPISEMAKQRCFCAATAENKEVLHFLLFILPLQV